MQKVLAVKNRQTLLAILGDFIGATTFSTTTLSITKLLLSSVMLAVVYTGC
jgi:hypothetical protein